MSTIFLNIHPSTHLTLLCSLSLAIAQQLKNERSLVRLVLICVIFKTLLINARVLISPSWSLSCSSLIFSSISSMFLMTRLEGSMQVRCSSEVVSLNRKGTYWLSKEKWNLGSRDRVGMVRVADLMMRGANLTPNIIKYNLEVKILV